LDKAARHGLTALLLPEIWDLERDALARLSATQLAGYHAVITALQEAC